MEVLWRVYGGFIEGLRLTSEARFPSSPLIIRVPFFLLFGFNKGNPKEKG